MSVKDAAREAAFEAIASQRDAITRVCREIHHDPELALEEHRAAERLTMMLEGFGYTVERGIAGLPTAFHARYDNIDPEVLRKGARHAHIGLIAEYDALPDVGHAHGHPLGTAAILAAAVGLRAALETERGSVSVIGCPGTAVGAKIRMARAGVFAPLDAAIGAHPAPAGEGFFYTIDSSGNSLGSAEVTITYEGDDGAEAASERLNQALASTPPETQQAESISVIDRTSTRLVLEVRAASRQRIVELLVHLKDMAQNAAEGTGVETGFTVANVYDDMIVNRVIARRMNTYAFNLGLRTDKSYKMPIGEPTEWGSVSYETPTFQAFYPVSSEPLSAGWGEASFATASVADDAFDLTYKVAESITFVALDILRDIDFRAIADNQLVKSLAARGETRAHRRWTGLHPVRPKESTNGAKKGPQLKDFKIVRQGDGGGASESPPPKA
jgi:metal-dependent amidase/aminoacylase/carboxypeptidase family protein